MEFDFGNYLLFESKLWKIIEWQNSQSMAKETVILQNATSQTTHLTFKKITIRSGPMF